MNTWCSHDFAVTLFLIPFFEVSQTTNGVTLIYALNLIENGYSIDFDISHADLREGYEGYMIQNTGYILKLIISSIISCHYVAKTLSKMFFFSEIE